jgi:exoribonuclease-2
MTNPRDPHAHSAHHDGHHRHIDLVAVAKDVARREGFVVDFPAGSSFDEERSGHVHVHGATSADAGHRSPAPSHAATSSGSHAVRGVRDDGDAQDVRDERALLWTSIDNAESTDLDQIEVSERLPGDAIRLKLGIADVDAFVPRGSALDTHAAANTTSLYAGIATFPMLPDSISSGDSSLLPGRDRLALVTSLVIERDGTISSTEIYRARVKNHAKLVYDEVGPWLDGHGPVPDDVRRDPRLGDQVRMQDEAAHRLRQRRIDRGALELETVEARAIAKAGNVVDVKIVTKNRARELIEDLMIAANASTAQWLEDRRYASLRRVVRTPRRWDRIVELARAHGTDLPLEPNVLALSTFLKIRRAAAPHAFAELSLSVVKLLGPGEYAVADPDYPEGHFGLAVDDYAHSTAPNRRYGDLVTQRILKAASHGRPSPYTVPELGEIAARCTERENHARKFERTMRKVASSLHLSSHIGETFDAIVTGATDKGTFVRLLDPPAEGRVVGDEQGLDVGDALRVRLVATEPTRGFIDFVRIR